MADQLHLRLLGAPRCLRGGMPVRFVRRKALALLAYLAVTNRPHQRDTLAGLLAGNLSEPQARQHLRNALHDLSAQLAGHLEVTRQTVALRDVPGVVVDVRAFERQLASALAARDTAGLEQAVTWYAGDLLEGFSLAEMPALDEWLLLERERLRTGLLDALQALIDLYTAQGNAASAIVAARRLLALEPYREQTYLQLMELLVRSGQRTAALAQYEACRTLLADELGMAPSTQLTALYEQLRVPAGIPPHNLPPWQAPFIGRTREIEALVGWLADPACRIVTIVGLGGSGKTRLALHVAARYLQPELMLAAQPFPDGVYVVPLAAIEVAPEAEPNTIMRRIVRAISRALDLALPKGEDNPEALLASLRLRRILLLLDNAEHLRAGAGFLAELITAAPGVTLLVTSRIRMQLQDEQVLDLGGLALPETVDQVDEAEASRLFLQQARKVAPGLTLADADRAGVVRICRAVQGLPLALVLAANWVRTLGVNALAGELEQSLDTLSAPLSDLPDRQRSMRTVLAWSWRQLAPDARDVLACMAVLQGSFDREAAQAVAGAGVRQLHMLQDQALIGRVMADRYQLHELVRQFAAEQLDGLPDVAALVRERHARYYAGRLGSIDLERNPTRAMIDLIDTDAGNLEAAWCWAGTQGRSDLLAQLGPTLVAWLDLNGLYQQAIALFGNTAGWLRQVEPVDAAMLGRVLAWQSRFQIECSRYDAAGVLLVEAEALAGAAGDMALAALVQYYRGVCAQRQHAHAEAIAALQGVLERARQTGSVLVEIDTMRALGAVALNESDFGRAGTWFDQALALARTTDARRHVALLLADRGGLAFERSAYTLARECQLESLAISQALGDRPAIRQALAGLGQIAQAQGDFGSARSWFEQSLALARAMGDIRAVGRSLYGLGVVATFQRDYVAAEAWADENVRLMRALGDQAGLAQALVGRAHVDQERGEYTGCRRLLDEALGCMRAANNQHGYRRVLNNLGIAAMEQGDLDAAQHYLEESLAGAEATEYLSGVAFAQNNLGMVALLRGDVQAARDNFAASAAIRIRLQETWTLAYSLAGLVAVVLACAADDAALWPAALTAARLAGVVEALLTRADMHLTGRYARVFGEAVARAQAILGADEFAAARAAGHTIPPEVVLREVVVNR